jgi:isoaspartyl peptidase/L-asparaginase-like protein (Ntn-hydrolase superfamily)
MKVLLHGGAGPSSEHPDERKEVLDEASEVGARKDSPKEAVVSAITKLEGSEQFNAGVGGSVQSDGVIRTDAGVMKDDLSVGAVCGMRGVKEPIRVADLVMEETPHVLLAGKNAAALAEGFGVKTDSDLWTEGTKRRWEKAKATAGKDLSDASSRMELSEEMFGTDTVGAVAFDQETGSTAAGTSTGGRWFAVPGRVGDVPQVGSGFYCNGTAAASATGIGEDIARVTLCRLTVEEVSSGLDPQEATRSAVERFEERTGSKAGVIATDSQGETGSFYNTEEMQTSVAEE